MTATSVHPRRRLAVSLALAVAACFGMALGWGGASPAARGQEGSAARVPAFGDPATTRFTTVATADDGLDRPRDLQFNPLHPEELWIVNQGTDGTVMLTDAGGTGQKVDARTDAVAFHFMDQVSGIAFAPDNTFGTCHESRNDGGGGRGDDYMGPTQWTANLDIYAKQNQAFTAEQLDILAGVLREGMCLPGGQRANLFGPPAGDEAGPASEPEQEATPTPRGAAPRKFRKGGTLGSHIDMLHQSPQCMGIAWGHKDGYWVTDGMNDHVVSYDFKVDHGYGGDDHSDGVIRRYVEAPFTRVAGVPGHLDLDRATNWLYYADTGEGKVRRLDVTSGRVARALPQRTEPLAEFSEMKGAKVEVFVETGLTEPSGVTIAGDILYVGDHADNTIRAYDLATGDLLGELKTPAVGLMGLTVGADGKLWFTDGDGDMVYRVDPQVAPPTGEPVEPTQAPAEPSSTPVPPTDEPTAIPTDTPVPAPTDTPVPTRWWAFLPWLGRR